MNIIVKELIGTRCIIKEDGQKIFEQIHPELCEGHEVCLDFSGVEIFASPFFNFAVGQLFVDLTKEQINENLHYINLNDVGCNLIKRVMDNASTYQKYPDYQKIIDDILKSQEMETA